VADLEGIAFSDVHLDGLNKHFPDANDRILAEMEKIYQYAYSNGIKHVFIPGDLSDTPDLDWDTYGKLYDLFLRHDENLYTYYIMGNHDFGDIENTSMNFMHKLATSKAFKRLKIILKPERVVIENVPVNFLPYPCLKTLSTKQGALNFAHVEYSGAIGDNGRSLKTKHELETHKNDFTISGHIHQYQFMKAKRAVYCGNPFQKNFGEALPKGFIHFKASMDGNRVAFQHKFVENKPNFTLQNVEINDLNDYKKLVYADNVRYKLHVAEDVPIPADLMIQYPNITGGIHKAGAKKSNVSEDESIKVENIDIDPMFGLKEFMVAEGFDKEMIKAGRKEVKKACARLGISAS
jgi:DNA repair exonuclease SbcCD nuclease subunit